MGNIVLLDDLTINKIAAGEVIERPASVIKELVENSIDAGATNITVEIRNGGISYIRVTDNGKGFEPDDMEIAFERHATSKIRSADDLHTVTSMGFRGEALASIAAIAKVTLKSKTMQNDTGYSIVIEGGDVLEKTETGCPNGSSITIENLFYNTPVRYKFLKKDFTEAGYIEDVITRIALVNPQIAIRLINTGKTVIQTSGKGDLKSVVYNIYGKDIAENILEVEYPYEDIVVKGVIGKPVIARSNRSNQLFFVNKRYIRDKVLTGAAEQAFKGLLTIGKFGFLILNLQMNPEQVDVNVHPAKLEVRFQEENKVFKAVYHAIHDTLLKTDLVSDKMKEKDSTKIFNEEEVKALEQKQEQEAIQNKGLFQRFMKKEEEIHNPNLVEDLFNSRNTTKIETIHNEIDSQFNSIMKKMQEMKEGINKDKQSLGMITVGNIEMKPNGDKIELTKTQEAQEEVKEDIKQNNQEENKEQIEKQEEKVEQKDNQEENKEQDKVQEDVKQEESILEPIQKENIPEQSTREIPEEPEKTPDQKLAEELSKKGDSISYAEFNQMYHKIFGAAQNESKKQETIVKEEKQEYQLNDVVKETNTENISLFEKTEEQKKPVYKLIGVAFLTYIIIEMGNEIYMIDQHAAHERILYEKVKKNYYNQVGQQSQLMLLPDIITLSHKEMGVMKDNMDMFKKAGFELEEFGENTIKLTGVPSICLDMNTKELFLETLDEINTVARTAKQEIEDRFIATIACKAAVKANMALTKEEIDNLIVELLKLPNPFTCPHGRPTAIKMTKGDLERKFSRR